LDDVASNIGQAVTSGDFFREQAARSATAAAENLRRDKDRMQQGAAAAAVRRCKLDRCNR